MTDIAEHERGIVSRHRTDLHSAFYAFDPANQKRTYTCFRLLKCDLFLLYRRRALTRHFSLQARGFDGVPDDGYASADQDAVGEGARQCSDGECQADEE